MYNRWGVGWCVTEESQESVWRKKGGRASFGKGNLVIGPSERHRGTGLDIANSKNHGQKIQKKGVRERRSERQTLQKGPSSERIREGPGWEKGRGGPEKKKGNVQNVGGYPQPSCRKKTWCRKGGRWDQKKTKTNKLAA